MKRLFWKIFLSFWLALLLFTVGSVFIAGQFIEAKRQEQDRVSPRAQIQQLNREARHIAADAGSEGLKRWLQELDRREVVPFLLLDDNHHDLLDRPVPDYLIRHLDRRRGHLPGILIEDGTLFHLTPDYRGVTLGRILVRPRIIAIPVLFAMLVSGLVCWLLARYLTRPLRRLHQATEEYADGNFSIRVAPGLGKRQDEIADLATAFDRMAEKLDSLLRSHKRLLRDASHELRSPLARLQVSLELARGKSGNDVTQELNRIEREADRLDELVGQLLSLARLESQQQFSHTENILLADLLKQIRDDACYERQQSAEECTVTLETGDVTSTIRGDLALLHSAIENVVRNAIRYAPDTSPIAITLRLDNQQPAILYLSVCDQGPGVPEDILPQLFDPFVRVDEARSREQGGYGLGLAITERIIRLHGGQVTAHNAQEGGLCVEIRLPVAGSTSPS